MFLPRLPSEFSPVFRLLDDFDTYTTRRAARKPRSPSSFVPRFDVRESSDGYHLDGELPGVSQEDVQIEFTDDHTLVIKGHSQRKLKDVTITQDADSDNNSTKSYQPTVEDEEATSSTVVAPEPKPKHEVEPEHDPDNYLNYLVSERSIGEFHRTFTFPTQIDQDGVKARLKNGILSVDIPREATRAKKIRVE